MTESMQSAGSLGAETGVATPLNRPMRWLMRINQPLVLAAGFLVVSLIVAVAIWMVGSVRDQNDRLVHTQDVQNRITMLLLDMRRAESAQRGFLLTGSAEYEAIYQDSVKEVPGQIERLTELVSDNEKQIRAVKDMTGLINQRLGQFAEVVRLRATGDTAAALAKVRDLDGQRVMEQMRAIAQDMLAEERRLFDLRSAGVDRSGLVLLLAMLSGFLLLVALAALSVFLVRRSNAERDQALEVLEATNENLEETIAIRTADLQEANAEIQRFAYIVSHDLRSPLVNIMGFTSELEVFRQQIFEEMDRLRASAAAASETAAEMGTAGDPGSIDEMSRDFDEALGFIKAAIGKMDRLINAILRLSREGRRDFKPEPVDMTELVSTLVETVAHQAEEREAAIFVGDLPQVASDRLGLEQIFSNLIDNALKYLRKGVPGRIEVSGRATLTHVTYEVIDNGRGIDPKDHQRIFDLFRRAGEQDQPGEGMGLAHVRALVRRMGGTLNVTSASGQGSTFTVVLPRRPPQGERNAA